MGLFSKLYGKEKDCIGTLVWEEIKNEGNSGGPQYTHRAKVHAGWLVDTQNYNGNCGGLAFIPDPSHQWQLG